MPQDRITRLEEREAYLSRSVDELSDVVAGQSREIDVLTRRVRMLMERLAEAEADASGSIPLADRPPPHW